MAKTTTTTDTMKIRLGVLWKVEIDDNVDSLDVDTTRQQIRADQVSANAISKIVEDAVTVRLQHLCVRVEARVSELGNLFRQELHTVGRVTENDGLVDLELLCKESREKKERKKYQGKYLGISIFRYRLKRIKV